MMREAEVRDRLRIRCLQRDAGARTVSEFWVPVSNERVDLAVLGARMTAFEIKTEFDSLRRLPRQAAAYARVFEECSVVLASRHVEKAMQMVPAWWGVLVISPDSTFDQVRPAEPNPQIDPETLVRLLHRSEAEHAIAVSGLDAGLNPGRFRMWQVLLSELDTDALQEVVRSTLLHRDDLGRPTDQAALTLAS